METRARDAASAHVVGGGAITDADVDVEEDDANDAVISRDDRRRRLATTTDANDDDANDAMISRDEEGDDDWRRRRDGWMRTDVEVGSAMLAKHSESTAFIVFLIIGRMSHMLHYITGSIHHHTDGKN